MWTILGDIAVGIIKGIIEGQAAAKEEQNKIVTRIVSLLRTGADAIEAAQAAFASEDAETREAFAERRRQLAMMQPTPMPPADEDTDPGKLGGNK